ncbi:MAG: flagellar biosynthesis anti-sigma factor FlgM [Eubacterium sp.]
MRVDAYMQVSQLYKTNKPKGTTKKNTATATDSLEISGFGKDYQIAKKAVAESSEVRADRVKDIMERMKAGTYNVSIEDLAEKMADRILG